MLGCVASGSFSLFSCVVVFEWLRGFISGWFRVGVFGQGSQPRKLGKRLVRGYPIIEAEVVYCMKYEMCETPEDFIARRTRLLFLDKQACVKALPRIVEIMAIERGWGRWRMRTELRRALDFCDTF